jgi:hypothetical protein
MFIFLSRHSSMEILALGALAGIAVVTTENTKKMPEPMDPVEYDSAQIARDIADAGDVYYIQGRSNNMAESQLKNLDINWLPRSAPRQEPTKNLLDVVASKASNTALIELCAPKFFFHEKDILGIQYGAPTKNNGYNIGAQVDGVSFSGDPNFQLAQGTKVFVDRFRWPSIPDYTNFVFKGDGEPTEHLRAELGDEADVMINRRNPYGPHGYYTDLMRSQVESNTRRRGNLKPTPLAQPVWETYRQQYAFVPQVPGRGKGMSGGYL